MRLKNTMQYRDMVSFIFLFLIGLFGRLIVYIIAMVYIGLNMFTSTMIVEIRA